MIATCRVTQVWGWWDGPTGRVWCADLDSYAGNGRTHQLQLTEALDLRPGQWVRVDYLPSGEVIRSATVELLTPAEAAELDPITGQLRRKLFALLGKRGLSDDGQRYLMSGLLGRRVESRSTLTATEARQLIATLGSDHVA